MDRKTILSLGVLGSLIALAPSSKSNSKKLYSNPSSDDLRSRIKYYTGQTPKVEDSTYYIKYKLPKRPTYLFHGEDSFFKILKTKLEREGYDVSLKISGDQVAIKLLNKISRKETPVDTYAKEALALSKKKSGSYKTFALLHKSHPAIFASRAIINDDEKRVIIILDADKSDAIVFDPDHPSGHITKVNESTYLSGDDYKQGYRGQQMRRSLNREPLFGKYNLKAVLETRVTEKNQGARATDSFMVMYVRQSFSDYYTLLVLTKDKMLFRIEWDMLAKKVSNYSMSKA